MAIGMLLHQARLAFRDWFGVMPEITQGLRDAVMATFEAVRFGRSAAVQLSRMILKLPKITTVGLPPYVKKLVIVVPAAKLPM